MKLSTLIIALLLTTLPPTAFAGNLDAPGTAGSNMPTTTQIYSRLDTGAAIPSPDTSQFINPSAGPTAGTGRTLAEIGAKLPLADNTNGAAAADVLSGKTFWGLRTDGTWGLSTGTIISQGNVTGGNGSLTISIPNGYYSGGKTATATDANLVAGNIRSGVALFGVSGKCRVVPATDQTISYAAGDAGAYRIGCLPAVAGGYSSPYNVPSWVASNTARFTDNSNGTVTDNYTGLIWLKDANCFGQKKWANALSSANNLASGSCGLTDGSTAGQWRLPNVNELHSLGPTWPPGSPFTSVQSTSYWSSSTVSSSTTGAWFVYMDGYVLYNDKSNTYYVWPVRGGQ